MIQLIGIIEIIIFYLAYFWKDRIQKTQGIHTNQLGKGDKSQKTIIIETFLRYSSIVIVLVILISVLINTCWFSSQRLRLSGLVVIGLGTCIFILAMLTMGNSWRAGIPPKDKTVMITSGIYKISRNPAFLGFDLTYIGAVITFGNIVLTIVAVLTIIMMHLQILEEEQFLEKTFGSKYLAYKRAVGRYFMFL